METVWIEGAAYDRLVDSARAVDPEPCWGALAGSRGIVRTVYPFSAEKGKFEGIAVSAEEACDIHQRIAADGEQLMGWFDCFRSVTEDGRQFQSPKGLGSGWVQSLIGGQPAPWVSIDVDFSPELGGAPRHDPVSASLISTPDSSDPNWWRRVAVRIVGSVELGADVDTGRPVRIGMVERRQGLYVIGKTGMGKSTLLESLIRQDMQAGVGLCVLDPHGDLVEGLLSQIPPARERDVVLLDLADTKYPFGLNLFECSDPTNEELVERVQSHAVQVFEKLWGDLSWGPRVENLLRQCAYTLIANPGSTLAEIPNLLLDKDFQARLVANVRHQPTRTFWEQEYPLWGTGKSLLDRLESTLNKVNKFLSPILLSILGFGQSTIDARAMMDDGKIILVSLPFGRVGETATSLVGSTLVSQLLNAAVSRADIPRNERRQFNIYADEYHRFATPVFAELLAEARKFAIGTTLAHQYRSQLDDSQNRGATLNAGNLLVFAVHGEDAEEMAKQFQRTIPEPEMTGRRAVLSVTQDPIGHLVRSGHENPIVRGLIAERLQDWVRWGRELRPGDRVRVGDHAAQSHAINEGLKLMNGYFVACMEASIDGGSAAEAAEITDIVVALRGLIGFAPDARDMGSGRQSLDQATIEALREYLGLAVADGPALDALKHAEARLSSARVAALPIGYTGPSREDRAESDVLRLKLFVSWLRKLGQGLAKTPILVDSGQWEAVADRPRSYADVEAEMASDLVGLDKYEARFKVLTGRMTMEGTVRTPEFEWREASDETEAMADRVRQRTRSVYCAPRAEVIERINARRPSGGPSPESRTTRRAPLTD